MEVYPGTVVFNDALSIRDITADRFNAYSLYAIKDGTEDAVIEAADAREIESNIIAQDGGRISEAFTQNAAYLIAFTDQDDASDISLSFSSGTTWNVVPSNTVLANADGCYVSRLTNLTLDNANVNVGTTARTFSNGTGFVATQTRLSDADKPVKGKYHNWGIGLSVEAWHKFDKLGADKTWFIEPQAQLSWYHINGDSFSMDNGMRVELDDSNNLTGRLGIVAGREIALEGSRMWQYYLKVGINHEFMGDQKISLNGVVFDEDGIMGTRFYYGTGMDWELDNKTRLYG